MGLPWVPQTFHARFPMCPKHPVALEKNTFERVCLLGKFSSFWTPSPCQCLIINTHAHTTDTNEEPYSFTHFRLISLDFVRNLKDSDHPLLWSNHVFKPLDHLKRKTAEDNTRKKGKIVKFFFLVTDYRRYTFSWVADTQCLRYLNPTGRSAEKMFTRHLKHPRKTCGKDIYTSWIQQKPATKNLHF